MNVMAVHTLGGKSERIGLGVMFEGMWNGPDTVRRVVRLG